jgi:acetylornithine deacetylase
MTPSAAVRLLREFVAIPSVNPMGRDDLPAEVAGEARYAEAVRAELARLGLDAVVIGAKERPSVVAEARVPGARETLIVASHLDTVPVDGMEIAPFDPVLRDGRVYGRGSCDTKAGMAALLAALARVLPAATLRRNLVVVGEADEERGSIGVYDVLRHLGSRAPGPEGGWVIATEPTELRVVTRHKGIALSRLEARGLACHSSDPSAGRNAIVHAARAALALDALNEKLAPRRDPWLGAGSVNVGLIGGGHAPNVVPDSAWLVCDRRLLPGEDAETVRREIEEALRGAGLAEAVALAELRIGKPPLGTDPRHYGVLLCQAALREVGFDPAPASVAFATDAGVFTQARGLPGVVLGPGSIAQAHTAREWVAVPQVEAMVEIFRRILERPA